MTQQELDKLIDERIKAMFDSGKLDRAMAQNFGVRRKAEGQQERGARK